MDQTDTSLSTKLVTIAGHDPSGGAGIVRDIQTFALFGFDAAAVCTATTIQNTYRFSSMTWVSEKEVIAQLTALLEEGVGGYFKIGLVEELNILMNVIQYIKNVLPQATIIWDPVAKASAGFTFHDSFNKNILYEIATNVDLITPNVEESKLLFGDKLELIESFTQECSILIKGGHNKENHCNDILYGGEGRSVIEGNRLPGEIHGSGCALSSAILANIAKGENILEACRSAKAYVTALINKVAVDSIIV